MIADVLVVYDWFLGNETEVHQDERNLLLQAIEGRVYYKYLPGTAQKRGYPSCIVYTLSPVSQHYSGDITSTLIIDCYAGSPDLLAAQELAEKVHSMLDGIRSERVSNGEIVQCDAIGSDIVDDAHLGTVAAQVTFNLITRR